MKDNIDILICLKQYHMSLPCSDWLFTVISHLGDTRTIEGTESSLQRCLISSRRCYVFFLRRSPGREMSILMAAYTAGE